MHVYRWDLDRTYLETEIHSVRGLVRAAMEAAGEKRTVPGADALLRAIKGADPQSKVAVLSGSPEQMRAVLAEKLALDGVHVDQLTLKDNLGNLKRGRIRALRNQIGFKLPHLLEHRLSEAPETKETLFGDDSETDALVYASYAAFLAGEIDLDRIVAILRAGDAYPDAIERAVAAARGIARFDAVRDIFIRVDLGRPLALYRSLGARVIPVFSWYQAALVLFARGLLPRDAVEAVRSASGQTHQGEAWTLDAVRRGLIARAQAEDLLSAALFAGDPARGERISQLQRSIDRLGPPASETEKKPLSEPDFLGFLQSVRR